MKVAAWNVNSVRARLAHVLAYLAEAQPDVALLQETKSKDENFPFDDFRNAGYEVAHCGQPSYNGVAVLSRSPLADAACGMPNRADDKQARVAAATVTMNGAAVRLISAYIPNGSSVGSEKYEYKLSWLADFADYIADAARDYPGGVIVGGDFNIAPADEDIYDADDWGRGNILTSQPERDALAKLLDAGYADAHRLFEQPAGMFSWWDYRAASFARNRGLRIDLFLLSEAMAKRCKSCAPDTTPRAWEKPSDHAPVVAEFRAD